MNLQEEIQAIVVEQLGLPSGEDLTSDKSFVEDLNADSLDLTELVMTVEERFNIDVPQAEAEKLATFGDLLEFVQNQRDGVADGDAALAQAENNGSAAR